ncbi:MAG: GntR family transcriptional regulator [Eubacterium sp.]
MEIPIYIQIAEDIKEKIKQNVLKSNDALPSEATLCKTYDVSRLTVRKSLELLSKDGYIYLIPGKGNFVRKISDNRYQLRFNEINFETVNIDRITVVDVDIIQSTRELIYHLQIEPKIRVLRLLRILYAKEVPVGYDIKYIPYYPGIPLVESELEGMDFSQILSNKISPYTLEKELTILPETADIESAKALKLSVGAPLLSITERMTDRELGIVGYGQTYYNPMFIKLKAFWEK